VGVDPGENTGLWSPRRKALLRPKADPAPAAIPDRERFADLVAAIAASQDRDAFAEVFAYYAPRVKAYMLRLGAGAALAEELAQEVLLTVWRKAGLYDRRQASVSTWIFRIARNRRIDAARRVKSADIDPEDPSLHPEAPAAPDDAVSAGEIETRVREALDTLPAEQVDLVRQAFYDGLSHREIAERTGIPLGTVKSRIRLAFGKLRGLLTPDDA
jgi:RNA polymerase sigma-70 factor, ECF subfamily